MQKKVKWEVSPRLISYFAGSIYGSDFDVVVIREALQNSVDAKAKTFRVNIIDDKHVVTENNGTPMTLKQIENQLFTLGESTKTDGSDTGFFGVGECAIISPCEKWKIETGKYIIEDFNVTENNHYFNGTKHTLTFKKSIRSYKIRNFLEFHNVKTKVIYQDTYGTKTLRPQKFNRCRKFGIPNGIFIWKKTGDDKTVLRVNGVPQYYDNRYDNSGTWIIDLNTSEILTVNREQIRDEETKRAVNVIKEHIRKISEHVSGDVPKQWFKIDAPYLFYRREGSILRRDVNSAPLQKMYESLKMVNQFYERMLQLENKEYTHKHKIALCFAPKETRALVKDDTILINVNKRKIVPPTTFILTLIDVYAHELAHMVTPHQDHEKTATHLRKIAWKNPKIIETLRKNLRYD